MGHSSISSTQRYLHLIQPKAAANLNLLDRLAA
jgi:hypothetical protein